jgi:hypothetical protein
MKTRSHNHCCRGKALRITYSECVAVALVIQHTNRMKRIVLSSVACPDPQYFSTLSDQGMILRGGGGHETCFDFLYNFRLKPFPF